MNVYDKNHPHNAVFVAQLQSIIDGSPCAVQTRLKRFGGNWVSIINDIYGAPITTWGDEFDFRIGPPNVTRTLTYPEPLRVVPEVGTAVWILNPGCLAGFSKGIWVGYSGDKIYFKRGFVFATESDAAEAARVIFGG